MYCTLERPCLGEFGYVCSETHICRGGLLHNSYQKCLYRLDDYLRGIQFGGIGPYSPRDWYRSCEVRTRTIAERRACGYLHDDVKNRDKAMEEIRLVEDSLMHHDVDCTFPLGCGIDKRCDPIDSTVDYNRYDRGIYCLNGSDTSADTPMTTWTTCAIAFGTATEGPDDRLCVQCGEWHKTRDEFLNCFRAMIAWYVDKLSQNGRLVNV